MQKYKKKLKITQTSLVYNARANDQILMNIINDLINEHNALVDEINELNDRNE